MLIRDIRQAARTWANEVLDWKPGIIGAFSHGSTNWLTETDQTLPHSDLDIIVVIDNSEPDIERGKFMFHGALLDVSFAPAELFQSAESILGQSHLAGSFRESTILLDPTGKLGQLRTDVARGFARRNWVQYRCDQVIQRIMTFLGSIDPARPFYENVTSCLFGTGVTTHVLLIAGLQNPTVRRRYVAVREMLDGYGRLDVHDQLLALLGSRDLTREHVQRHLDSLERVFDVAAEEISSPFFFASDISPMTRDIAVKGSAEMIENGDYREAMFWIAATWARCMAVLDQDASPSVYASHEPAFMKMTSDLGIESSSSLEVRADAVRAFLPRLTEIANEIINADPAVTD